MPLIHVEGSIYKTHRRRPRHREEAPALGQRPQAALELWCPHLDSAVVNSASWGEDEIQCLALSSCHVGMPQVHHEDHTGTLLWGTWVG